MNDFAHLHLHSQFSLLDGANRLDDVLGAAQRAGQPAVALTDHGNLFGAIEFYQSAKNFGVKPIIGMEAYITSGRYDDKQLQQGGDNFHLVLLARNETGYRNLLKLTSRSFLEGFYYKPRIDHRLLAEHSEGLIALSACLKGEVNQRIMAGREDEAEAKVRQYLDILGEGNFYLEMQDHGIAEQRQCNEVLRGLSRKLGVPMVVSNDCHYLRREDAEAHDVLLCIGTQRTFDDPDRMRYASENFYMKSADEMYALFPNDAAAIENTVAIAERCALEIETGKFHLPAFTPPAGETLDSYFARVAREGLEVRLEALRRGGSTALASLGPEVYRQRLENEIGVIIRMGFPGYFLVVWDFIRYSRENRIPVGPGRGSAAGSLVSYALRITDIDPLQYDLLFERFLNPERISMPDIDIDFCMRRRGEVINYVTEKYGRDHVAQIITFGTLAAKAVIRDVGRVMGLPYATVDRIAKLVPDMTKSLGEAAKEGPLKAEVAKDPQVAKIVEIGTRLEGLTRHASVHAAGVVITPQPIEELVPLYKVKKGDEDTVTTQWDMTVVESLGLLKMDFLGLRTLTVIDDALEILARQGTPVDFDQVPLDDPEVYRLFCEGRTNGIFQFESSGMKDLLRRAQPSRFEDLAAFNALYRPGTLTSGMVEEYIQRKLGKRKVSYFLPGLEKILEETYGVIVYQEQVMLLAVTVSGFSMAQADALRKAMGKKKLEVMQQQKKLFLDGADSRGVDRKKAEELWDYIEPFAGYGFNKSHSVAYAMLAFRTAYLKAHHPVAFMTAMFNSEFDDSDAIAKYVRECQAMGITVLPPDVNESDWRFTVVGDAIRYGLGAVKGLGEGAVEGILTSRRRVGRFRGLGHFALEVQMKDANKKVFESLVKAGAFDSLESHRAALFASLENVLAVAQKHQKDQASGQGGLFGGGPAQEPAIQTKVTPWPERERLSNEKEALGFYLSGNPLSEHAVELEKLITHSTDELTGEIEGQVTVGGLVTRLVPAKIKSGMNAGRMMAKFVLEDLQGGLPVTLFANQYEQFGHLLKDEAVVLVKGTLRERGSELELSVEDIVSLESQARKLVTRLDLKIAPTTPRQTLRSLSDLLLEHHGRIPIRLRVALPQATVNVTTSHLYTVRHDPELVAKIEAMLGRGSVRAVA
ncbi:MAG: DNA polymerase III subunit alpha [Thermoanaerobaculia bacterium]|nr:DNA polymerase III subunit alpha [Thermoanaerobaculia bacterium]